MKISVKEARELLKLATIKHHCADIDVDFILQLASSITSNLFVDYELEVEELLTKNSIDPRHIHADINGKNFPVPQMEIAKKQIKVKTFFFGYPIALGEAVKKFYDYDFRTGNIFELLHVIRHLSNNTSVLLAPGTIFKGKNGLQIPVWHHDYKELGLYRYDTKQIIPPGTEFLIVSVD